MFSGICSKAGPEAIAPDRAGVVPFAEESSWGLAFSAARVCLRAAAGRVAGTSGVDTGAIRGRCWLETTATVVLSLTLFGRRAVVGATSGADGMAASASATGLGNAVGSGEVGLGETPVAAAAATGGASGADSCWADWYRKLPPPATSRPSSTSAHRPRRRLLAATGTPLVGIRASNSPSIRDQLPGGRGASRSARRCRKRSSILIFLLSIRRINFYFFK